MQKMFASLLVAWTLAGCSAGVTLAPRVAVRSIGGSSAAAPLKVRLLPGSPLASKAPTADGASVRESAAASAVPAPDAASSALPASIAPSTAPSAGVTLVATANTQVVFPDNSGADLALRFKADGGKPSWTVKAPRDTTLGLLRVVVRLEQATGPDAAASATVAPADAPQPLPSDLPIDLLPMPGGKDAIANLVDPAALGWPKTLPAGQSTELVFPLDRETVRLFLVAHPTALRFAVELHLLDDNDTPLLDDRGQPLVLVTDVAVN